MRNGEGKEAKVERLGTCRSLSKPGVHQLLSKRELRVVRHFSSLPIVSMISNPSVARHTSQH